MMKMYIELDEEKILREQKYPLDKVKHFIIKTFDINEMRQNSDGWFTTSSFEDSGVAFSMLIHNKAVMENISKWLWYDSEEDFTNDVLKSYNQWKAEGEDFGEDIWKESYLDI